MAGTPLTPAELKVLKHLGRLRNVKSVTLGMVVSGRYRKDLPGEKLLRKDEVNGMIGGRVARQLRDKGLVKWLFRTDQFYHVLTEEGRKRLKEELEKGKEGY